jgi:hypothetical protein
MTASRPFTVLALAATAVLSMGSPMFCSDPFYRTTQAQPLVTAPAYATPLILLDTANSGGQLSTTWEGFAALAADDGYRPRDLDVPWVEADCAAGLDTPGCAYGEDALLTPEAKVILMIVLPYENIPLPDLKSDQILGWLQGGGSLLLALDHDGAYQGVQRLLDALGIVPGDDNDFGGTAILADHPIIHGRQGDPDVTQVWSDDGATLSWVTTPGVQVEPIVSFDDGGAIVHMALAVELTGGGRVFITGSNNPFTAKSDGPVTDPYADSVNLLPCGGSAFATGMGPSQCARVKVLEWCASMGIPAEDCASDLVSLGHRQGLPNADNTQLTLNVIHWLDGII